MENLLGKKLKALRKEHRITQAKLAEQLNVSVAYVGFLERGTRKGSNQTLMKAAEVYNLPPDELIKLRDGKNTVVNQVQNLEIHQEQTESPTKLENFVKKLSELDSTIQDHIVTELYQDLEIKLSKLLKPYTIEELNQQLIEVKDYWLSLAIEQQQAAPSINNVKGELKHDACNCFFKLELDESAFILTLLKQDENQLQKFEGWLGTPAISYELQDESEHFSRPEEMIKFLWFSPNLSIVEQLNYLYEQKVDTTDMKCNDSKLYWFILQNSHNAQTSAS